MYFAPPTNLLGWTRLLISSLRSNQTDIDTIHRLYQENDQLKRQVGQLQADVDRAKDSLTAILSQLSDADEVLRELRTYCPNLHTTNADLVDILRTITSHVRNMQQTTKDG